LKKSDSILSNPSFLNISKFLLIDLLKSENFGVDELKLFLRVVEWKNKNNCEDTNQIFSLIRYGCIPMPEMVSKVRPTNLAPKDLYLLSFEFQANKEITEPNTPKNFVPRVVTDTGKNFVYEKDFDKNGILYWIGTNELKDTYVNPHNKGDIIVTTSKLHGGQIWELIDWEKKSNTYTTNEVNSWIVIQFKFGEVKPNYYTIRHYSLDGYTLRNWRIEGSNDGNQWQILKNHVNDSSLAATASSTASWAIDNQQNFFSYFRILQHGPTVSGNYNNLMMSGLEIYGQYKKK